jgi:hypothetical protein
MKRIYEFITKANQVLLFLAVLGVSAFVTYLVYQDSSRHYQPPHVSIAQTPEALKKVVVDDVRLLGSFSGIYVFGVIKREVAPNGQPESNRKLKMDSSFSSREGDSGQIVNVVFSKDGRKVKTLLEADGLVLSHHLNGDYRADKFKAFLFLCATEDTDGNHVLDSNDRNDLYIISNDLVKPDIVIHGVLGYDIVSDTRLVVKTRDHDELHFTDVDIETLEKKEVKWK